MIAQDETKNRDSSAVVLDTAAASNADTDDHNDVSLSLSPPTPLSLSLPIPSKEELLSCLTTLHSLIENNRQGFEVLTKSEQIELIKAAGIFSKPSKDELFSRKKQVRKKKTSDRLERNKKARAQTGIRIARTNDVFLAPLQLTQHKQQMQLLLTNNNNNDDDAEGEVKMKVKVKGEGANNNNNNRTDDEEKSETKTSLQQPEKQQPPPPPPPELTSYRNCYVCKAKYTKLHFFYDTMCLQCGDLNYKKRFQTADLTNHVALITGSRLKIGYHATLLLLRAGAIVIATTRFPADSAIRYSKETDYSVWCTRLHIHGLDLRHTPSVELFCNYIEQTYHRLDILINNAATTVRRPPGFYSHMLRNEYLSFSDHPPSVQRLLTSHYKCLNNLLLPRTRGGDGGESCIRSSEDNNSYNKDISTSTIAITTIADGDVNGGDAAAATDISASTLTTTSGTDATADASANASASASANNNDFAAVTWDTKGPGIGLRASAQLSQIPYSYDSNGGDGNDNNSNGEGEIRIREEVLFPEGKLDVDLQQVDLRSTNSWRLTLGEISSMELLECMLVNAVAPFVLCNRLAPMMKRCSPNRHGCKHM